MCTVDLFSFKRLSKGHLGTSQIKVLLRILFQRFLFCQRHLAKQEPHVVLPSVDDTGNGNGIVVCINSVKGNLVLTAQHTQRCFKSCFCCYTDAHLRELLQR